MMYKGCRKGCQDKNNGAQETVCGPIGLITGIHFCTFYIFFHAYIPNGSHHILFMLCNN